MWYGYIDLSRYKMLAFLCYNTFHLNFPRRYPNIYENKRDWHRAASEVQRSSHDNIFTCLTVNFENNSKCFGQNEYQVRERNNFYDRMHTSAHTAIW